MGLKDGGMSIHPSQPSLPFLLPIYHKPFLLIIGKDLYIHIRVFKNLELGRGEPNWANPCVRLKFSLMIGANLFLFLLGFAYFPSDSSANPGESAFLSVMRPQIRRSAEKSSNSPKKTGSRTDQIDIIPISFEP